MSKRFEILVEGIDDPSLVADIRKTILDSFHEMVLPGAWRVVVKPSCVSGRWDFNFRGLDVWHTLSITVPSNMLPSRIPRRMRESLDLRAFRTAVAA